MNTKAEAKRERLTQGSPSWPGLSRPSTSGRDRQAQVDPDRKIGFVGIRWPSELWRDEPIPNFGPAPAAALGGAAAGVFLMSLIASGISSSVVGTMAGQMIMQGFVGFRIPIWMRRLITMVPAFIVVAMGVDATEALVVSQVVLSIALPFPLVALVVFTRDKKLMGQFANTNLMQIGALIGTVAIVALNGVLLAQTFGVDIPGLPQPG